jgi:DNA polymerase delta subunit 2
MHVHTQVFRNQFAALYGQRLAQMRAGVLAAARQQWATLGADVTWANSILGIPNDARCVVIGTIYKNMALKPNILDEYHAREVRARGRMERHIAAANRPPTPPFSRTQNYEAPPPARSKYNDDAADRLELEDGSGRVALAGPGLPVAHLVSGVVVALLGAENELGEFVVEDVCFRGLAPPATATGTTTATTTASATDPCVCLVSGLDVHAEHADALLPLSLFLDFVGGRSGSVAEHALAARIVRVVVAGNVIAGAAAADAAADQARFRLKNTEPESVKHVRRADALLAQLAAAVPTDVMPGAHDPANAIVPQQPLHAALFPRAAALATLQGVPNPYACSIGGVAVLGTSGQGVDDVYRFAAIEDRLAILEGTLQWGHLFPTAPDTLPCYPHTAADPFVIDACPGIYFAGNQPAFAAKTITGPHEFELLSGCCFFLCVAQSSFCRRRGPAVHASVRAFVQHDRHRGARESAHVGSHAAALWCRPCGRGARRHGRVTAHEGGDLWPGGSFFRFVN